MRNTGSGLMARTASPDSLHTYEMASMVNFSFAFGLPINSLDVSDAEGLNRISNIFQEAANSPQSPERTKTPWTSDL